MTNGVLGEACQRIIVENIVTGEQYVVITDTYVEINGNDIVVRMKPR